MPDLLPNKVVVFDGDVIDRSLGSGAAKQKRKDSRLPQDSAAVFVLRELISPLVSEGHGCCGLAWPGLACCIHGPGTA